MGVSIPLRDSYVLTTITAKLVVLDPSDPPFHLACYDFEITPFYPTYFAYPLIHYLPIGLLGTYLLIYLIARLWSAYTDFVHENETQLASSLTLKLSSTTAVLSKRKMWGTIWFGAWAGRQVVGSGSLRRFVTAELRELWVAVVWWTLVGTVAVDWPGFSCEYYFSTNVGTDADDLFPFADPIFAQTAWTALIYSQLKLPSPYLSAAESDE